MATVDTEELLAEECEGQRPEDREADHEGRLQGQDEEAVGGHELAALDHDPDHGRLSGDKKVVSVATMAMTM